MAYGTLSILDTLQAVRNQTVAQYGEDKTFEAIQVAFAARDRIVADMVRDLVEFTPEQQRNSGGISSFKAERLDEYGRPAPQKLSAGATLGFPMDRWGNALQWTRDWFTRKTPSELTVQIQAIMNADKANVYSQLRTAVFTPTNSTFRDWLVNNIDIPVKAFINADSFPVMPDPAGNAFDTSTHTHYLARAGASLAASDVTALVDTVREHYDSGAVYLYINRGDEGTMRALTGFTPYPDLRINYGDQTQRGVVGLNTEDTYDRAIGIYDGAEVWVKPWILPSYMFCYIAGNGAPLGFRTEDGQGAGALQLVSDIDIYPLRAQSWKREFGVGVANRVAGAVLYTGGTSYVAPTNL